MRALYFSIPVKQTFAAFVLTLTPFAFAVPAGASLIFNLQKETITISNDDIGTVGVRVRDCNDQARLLWEDNALANPFKSDGPGMSMTYPLEEPGFSATLQKVVNKLEAWKKLSISEKVKAAHPRDRIDLGKDLRETCSKSNLDVTDTPSSFSPSNNLIDADGCTDGRSMVYVNQPSGFLGLGSKKVPIGCMTQAELNRWNIEQQNARRPVYIPSIQPSYTSPTQPSYQAPALRGTGICTTQFGVTTCR